MNTPSLSSVHRYLVGSGFALWLLVLGLQPDTGFSAPLPWLGVFWGLQISCGLAVLQSLLYLLGRLQPLRQWPPWALVTASGVAGSVLLAPLYWLIGEGLMRGVLGFEASLDADDVGATPVAGLAAVVDEFLDIVGPVTAAWLLISWPRLLGLLPPPLAPRGTQVTPPAADSPVPAALADATVSAVPPALQPTDSSTVPRWRVALPRELGDDLIAVTSELQYLRVWTTRGSTLILGALQEVEDTEAAAGMRIHRSWWVHARHVRCVRRRADGLFCQLSDGREIPVSRRRRADVLARFGDAARYQTPAAQNAHTSASDSSNS